MSQQVNESFKQLVATKHIMYIRIYYTDLKVTKNIQLKNGSVQCTIQINQYI